MLARTILTALVLSAALGAAGGSARAEPVGGQLLLAAQDFSAPSTGDGAPAPKRTLEWDAAKSRWGLNLGVEQHGAGQDIGWRDVAPGVYYKLTRRLHIGGAVSLAPDQPDSARLGQPQTPAPRVRLETTFKF
jgi:hypothetical protein